MLSKNSILKIKLIVATSENNVIGIKNDLPWHLPDDMSYFKEKTQDSVVIMGRKNFLSIPEKYRPLAGRTNIILTKKKDFHASNCMVTNSLESAIRLAKEEKRKNIFIIGGGLVYKYALDNNLIDVIYLTRIHAIIKGDTFFPKLNLDKWKVISKERNNKDSSHKYDYTFIVLKKC